MLTIIEDIVSFITLYSFFMYYLEDEAWYYAAAVTGCFLFDLGVAAWHHNTGEITLYMIVSALWGISTWLAWKNRKKRKRRHLLSRAGYKGRAALLKLIKSMPRPKMPRVRIPAPVPG